MDKYDAMEKYADYEAYFDRDYQRQETSRAPKAKQKKVKPAAARAALTNLSDDIVDFVPTYARSLDPQHYERQWVIDSVAPLYRDSLITDVTRRVKAGKEANVYCCTAHENTGVDLIAAKLYRPRMLRTLKNDADYKAGRQLRGEDGKELRGRREKLAIRQKTNFGRQLDTSWWIGNEYSVQQKLLIAGADVPAVIAQSGNAILMEFIGDERLPAPTLNAVRLDANTATRVFDQVIYNMSLMLKLGFVHGDLSAYNILYWEGDIWIIDFPQVAETAKNPNARRFLDRDVTRVCDYFARMGVVRDSAAVSDWLWQEYANATEIPG